MNGLNQKKQNLFRQNKVITKIIIRLIDKRNWRIQGI